MWGTRKRELGTTEIEELDYSREHERVSPWSEVRGNEMDLGIEDNI